MDSEWFKRVWDFLIPGLSFSMSDWGWKASSSISGWSGEDKTRCTGTLQCKMNLFPQVPDPDSDLSFAVICDTGIQKEITEVSLIRAKMEVTLIFLNNIVMLPFFNRIIFLKQMAGITTYNRNYQWTIMSSKTKISKIEEKCQNCSLTLDFFVYFCIMPTSQKGGNHENGSLCQEIFA